jgi:hypothetical protein
MKSVLKRLDWRHKNNKFLYYVGAFWRQIVPTSIYRATLQKKLNSITPAEIDSITDRVNYYCKLTDKNKLSADAVRIGDLKIPKRQRAYYFDTREYLRYFNPSLSIKYAFGDVTTVPGEPSIVKSRPLTQNNTNSVVLKLDKNRHFAFASDHKNFITKKNMLVGRAVVKQPHRIAFYEKYFNHPLCNLGQTNRSKNLHWIKERLTIDEHLDYKFILCLEGNDVATNLKWVMSSNSLAIMPKPKFETWYMEGRLIPNHHYVEIKEDYSDLEERLQYYITHTDEALQIIKNANAYVEQFKNKRVEDLVSLCVLEKYFFFTNQRNPYQPLSY